MLNYFSLTCLVIKHGCRELHQFPASVLKYVGLSNDQTYPSKRIALATRLNPAILAPAI